MRQHSALAPRSWLRLPRRTARLRLTLLYAGLFLLSSTFVVAVVIGITVRSSLVATAVSRPGGGTVATAVPARIVGPTHPTDRQHLAHSVGSDISAQVVVQHAADIGGLLAASWVVAIPATILSAVLGWIAAGRVLRPVREITLTARTISAGNLNQRLALTGPDDEFKQLADTLDDLLGRLEASFEAQRRFVANASHELRTPLTLERTLLQVALADPHASAATLREICEELLVSGVEQERMLESLLTLASSERGLEERQTIDLATLTDHVLRSREHELERLSLQLDTALEPAATIGDPALIERLIANLLDNAAEYNVPGGRVRGANRDRRRRRASQRRATPAR